MRTFLFLPPQFLPPQFLPPQFLIRWLATWRSHTSGHLSVKEPSSPPSWSRRE
eukprot:GAFH01000370.1.p5 GENE.GAFH01000370.1~~GAFH01000370.1.p5  ORF type:complete len:53 (-),score=1.50 GAFH01000370.1:564-722(-)